MKMILLRWSGAEAHIAVSLFFTLVSPTSSSPSQRREHDETYLRLNNLTLPLKSFLREYCGREQFPDPRSCNESYPTFYCERTGGNGNHACFQWCIGEDGACSGVEECCGNEFDCINKICRSTNPRIDFMIVAKVALATALIITVFAVFTLCWKGFIEPRCSVYESRVSDDDISLNSERYIRELTGRVPPRYDIQLEKPPPYEECVRSSWPSPAEPPPYTVATNANDVPIDSVPDPPRRYYMPPESDLSQLSVRAIILQETPVNGVTEMIVSSPVTDMEDFVYFSTKDDNSPGDSASDSQTRKETDSDSFSLTSMNVVTTDQDHAAMRKDKDDTSPRTHELPDDGE